MCCTGGDVRALFVERHDGDDCDDESDGGDDEHLSDKLELRCRVYVCKRMARVRGSLSEYYAERSTG